MEDQINLVAEKYKQLQAEYVESRLVQKRLEEKLADQKKHCAAIGAQLIQYMQELEHKTHYVGEAGHRITITKRTSYTPTDAVAAQGIVKRFINDGNYDFVKCDNRALRDIMQRLAEEPDGFPSGEAEFYKENIREFTKHSLTFVEGTPAPSANNTF